jgi:hypothetical protein
MHYAGCLETAENAFFYNIFSREWHVLEELKYVQLCRLTTLVQYPGFQSDLHGYTELGLVCIMYIVLQVVTDLQRLLSSRHQDVFAPTPELLCPELQMNDTQLKFI